MNVTLTNVDSVNAILQVSIAKGDYQENYNNALKTFRRKANVPGFRPGTVPAGMVKKMYGKSILAEEVGKQVNENLYKYIQENKVNILGEPLPNEEKQQPLDFAVEGDFDFFYDIALAPEIKLSITQKDKVDYYKIAIDEETVEKQIAAYKSNYGNYEKIEDGAVETDLIKGEILELENGAPKAAGIKVEAGVVMPSYIKDKEEQAKFVGVKSGDVVTFNPAKAYEGNETEIASLLHIEKESLNTISPEFSFSVAEVTRYKEAEFNQEFFDKVFGEGTIKTEEEFRAKVKDLIAEQFAPDSDYKFMLDAKEVLEKKVGKLEFPDAFMKRWLLTTSKNRDEATLDAEYPKIIEDLTFHLIKEQIAKDNELKVENEDIKTLAMQVARSQFAQYGMMGLPDSMIENYANDMLKKEETARNLIDKATENKIIELLKTKMGVQEKEISLDEFRKFFEKEEDQKDAEDVISAE